MYSGNLRLRPPYIHIFNEDFCGLTQPLQANTGHILHMHYGHFLMHPFQMIFRNIFLRSTEWIFKHNWGVLVFKGRATLQALIRQPLTDMGRTRSQAIPCETCDAYDSSGNRVFPPEHHSTKAPYYNLHITLARGTNRWSLTFHKSNTLQETWNHWVDRLRKNMEGRLNWWQVL